MIKKIETVVIGAGIIGLAIARKFALNGKRVLVLESRPFVGMEMTFRNSAVIHAGIYYPANSLKAKLCVSGKEQLYDYCRRHHIRHRKIGKILVAANQDEIEKLEQLAKQGAQNGVTDLVFLSAARLKKMEPSVRAAAALFSPSSGIIHGRELVCSLQKDIEAAHSKIACGIAFAEADVLAAGFRIRTNTQELFECQQLVNAAGLDAACVAHAIHGLPKHFIPSLYYAKGSYFKYQGKIQPFSHLIYPLPEKAGLGIHATLDVFGVTRFGPDVEWVDTLDLTVNEHKKELFFHAIKQYFPAIQQNDLLPEFAGIRAKSRPPAAQPQDFEIQSEHDHGIPGSINLYGIESPGLTASLAIADHVHELLNQ